MQSINLKIDSIRFRTSLESYGSGKNYNKRLGLRISDDMNVKLKEVSKKLDIPAVEIIRQIVNVILNNQEGQNESC